MFRCHMKECHTHQSYSRCNGQRSNKAKKNTSEAGEANHDLKQRRNHDSTLDLVSEQKYMWDYTSYYKSNYFIISLVLTYDLLEDKREDDIISIFFAWCRAELCALTNVGKSLKQLFSNLTSLMRVFQMSPLLIVELSVELLFKTS